MLALIGVYTIVSMSTQCTQPKYSIRIPAQRDVGPVTPLGKDQCFHYVSEVPWASPFSVPLKH